jgi:hypothetical protein
VQIYLRIDPCSTVYIHNMARSCPGCVNANGNDPATREIHSRNLPSRLCTRYGAASVLAAALVFSVRCASLQKTMDATIQSITTQPCLESLEQLARPWRISEAMLWCGTNRSSRFADKSTVVTPTIRSTMWSLPGANLTDWFRRPGIAGLDPQDLQDPHRGRAF